MDTENKKENWMAENDDRLKYRLYANRKKAFIDIIEIIPLCSVYAVLLCFPIGVVQYVFSSNKMNGVFGIGFWSAFMMLWSIKEIMAVFIPFFILCAFVSGFYNRLWFYKFNVRIVLAVLWIVLMFATTIFRCSYQMCYI